MTFQHLPRILLCASAMHCTEVLRAAAQAQLPLHGLIPSTKWPTHLTEPTIVLWVQTPATETLVSSTEALWRTHLLPNSPPYAAVHMLYGNAAQQAQQIAPWLHTKKLAMNSNAFNECKECLDAASEQRLFQHLLAQT